jgi:hypothetical protein
MLVSFQIFNSFIVMATVIEKYKLNAWFYKIIVLENLKMNSLICEGNEAEGA